MIVSLEERFLTRTAIADVGCWYWQGGTDHYGYGVIRDSADNGGRLLKAHRVSYELLIGPIPDGLDLDHLCMNHGCVKPDHLEPVTRGENVRRAHEGLKNPKCRRGHDKKGKRNCQECKNLRNRAARFN